MRKLIIPSPLGFLIFSAGVLTACQSQFRPAAFNNTGLSGGPVSNIIHYRGAHPTGELRIYGHSRRYISYNSPVHHIVVISMENRTVDDLFAGRYSDAYTGPAGGTWGSALNLHNPNGNPQLVEKSLSAPFDPNHFHDVGWRIESHGNWGNEPFGCSGTCPSGRTVLAYAPSTETDIYKQAILNGAFASNVLQSNQGPSFVSHQYYIAAQSGGLPGALSSPDAEAENPQTPAPLPTGDYEETGDYDIDMMTGGCNGNGQWQMNSIDMSVPEPNPTATDNGPELTPCEEYTTILDEAAATIGTPAYMDWQYIAHATQSIWAAPMGVQHLYSQYLNGNLATQPFAVDPDAENFVLNVENSQNPPPNPVRPFAALTYITPCERESDHPQPGNVTDDGPEWLAYVINAIGESPYWNSTTIIVTWDDWGGWYDHVPSLQQPSWGVRPFPNGYGNSSDPNEWGFRVPLIVISPYVTPGYISNQATAGFQFRSQGVITQYVEATFGLNSLSGDDNQEGHIDGLKDMFNYSQTPLKYVPLQTSSPFVPANNGVCPNDP